MFESNSVPACCQSGKERVLRRFYLTLMLYDLWNQRSVWDVANEYQVPRGIVQNLMTSAAAFSSCVLRFCEVRKYSIHRRVITELTLLLRTLSCLLSTYSPVEDVIMLLVCTKNTQIERKFKQLQLYQHDEQFHDFQVSPGKCCTVPHSNLLSHFCIFFQSSHSPSIIWHYITCSFIRYL